jgi:hypothetical protein
MHHILAARPCPGRYEYHQTIYKYYICGIIYFMQSETHPSVDFNRQLLGDIFYSQMVAMSSLIFKPELRGILPEPADIGAHIGNFGMTLGLVAGGIGYARVKRLNQAAEDETSDVLTATKYEAFNHKLLVFSAVAAVALNVVAEVSPITYENPTADPIDAVYGFAGGLAAYGLMTHRTKRNIRQAKKQELAETAQQPKPLQTGRPKNGTTPAKSHKKNNRKNQQASRRKNR